jgi:phosphatidylcholine synthase
MQHEARGGCNYVRWLSALVHLFTALGAVCALLAAEAAITGDARALFFWLYVALVIDAIDGTFARAVNVVENLPRFSGERLDLVIDYLTYVFVPAMALLQWHYLDGWLGSLIAAGILLSSLFHFSDLKSKSKDNCFVGFPAIWNIFAFYAFALDARTWLVEVCAAVAILATFLPLPWVHPLRVARMRTATVIVTLVAALAGVVTLVDGPPAPPLVQAVLVAVAIYYVGLALYFWQLARTETA